MTKETRRTAEQTRKTNETEVAVSLDLDGEGRYEIATGVGFLDHLVETLTRHARLDLKLRCRGDITVDDHHTAEDSAIVLGRAFDQALGERAGIRRFGSSYAALDDALARGVVDAAARPYADVRLGLTRETIGGLSSENVSHFLNTFAASARLCLHADVHKGENDHHRAEAAVKAVALALRLAIALDDSGVVPSTKGELL